jgi:hypothetical protein
MVMSTNGLTVEFKNSRREGAGREGQVMRKLANWPVS